MTFQTPISAVQSRPVRPPYGVLMERKVSDHRWHFSVAIRCLGASIAATSGRPSFACRRPAYVDLIDCGLEEPLDLARRRVGWSVRPETLIVLVSPGPKLADLLRVAPDAEMIVVVVACREDWIGTRALRLLQTGFVLDGDEVVHVAGRPNWPRSQARLRSALPS